VAALLGSNVVADVATNLDQQQQQQQQWQWVMC
jgi:hypothetical protein